MGFEPIPRFSRERILSSVTLLQATDLRSEDFGSTVLATLCNATDFAPIVTWQEDLKSNAFFQSFLVPLSNFKFYSYPSFPTTIRDHLTAI